MWSGRGDGVKGSIYWEGNFSYQQNVWCISFENLTGSLFDSLFVCLFFFLQRELFLVFGALEPYNFISQNTVINDKMTSINQKIVYETFNIYWYFFFYCCRASVSLK